MDVPQLVSLRAQLGFSKRSMNKASELVRLSILKCRTLGPSEVCRVAACLQLACMGTGESVDEDQVIKCSGSSKKLFTKALERLRRALDLRFSITISQLAVQFGCMSMAEFAEQRLQEYKEKMGLDKQVDAAVIGAVFYLCARRSKARLDRAQLVKTCKCDAKTFKLACESVEAHCESLRVEATPSRPKAATKEKRMRRGSSAWCASESEPESLDAPSEALGAVAASTALTNLLGARQLACGSGDEEYAGR